MFNVIFLIVCCFVHVSFVSFDLCINRVCTYKDIHKYLILICWHCAFVLCLCVCLFCAVVVFILYTYAYIHTYTFTCNTYTNNIILQWYHFKAALTHLCKMCWIQFSTACPLTELLLISRKQIFLSHLASFIYPIPHQHHHSWKWHWTNKFTFLLFFPLPPHLLCSFGQYIFTDAAYTLNTKKHRNRLNKQLAKYLERESYDADHGGLTLGPFGGYEFDEDSNRLSLPQYSDERKRSSSIFRERSNIYGKSNMGLG